MWRFEAKPFVLKWHIAFATKQNFRHYFEETSLLVISLELPINFE